MMKLAGLNRQLRPYAEYAMKVAQYYGVNPYVTSVRRTWSHQSELYARHMRCRAQGRFPSAPDCLYPANPPGQSSHEYGLAFDSTVPEPQNALWDSIRRWVGFEVFPHDRIHAQVPNWRKYVFPYHQ